MKKSAADLQLSRPGRRPTAFTETGDRFSVERLEGDGFKVRHYPDPVTKKACCTVTVHMTDADRAKAIPDADPHGEAACLARADKMIEKRHAARNPRT